MHLKRIITTAIALPLLIILIAKGGALLFCIFISVGAIIAMYEYNGIVFNDFDYRFSEPLISVGYLFCPAIIWSHYFKRDDLVIFFIVFNLVVCSIISLFKYEHNRKISEDAIKQIFGSIYIALFLSFPVIIRNSDNGVAWIFFLISIVFAGDTGAFYLGTYCGRNKLALAISPNKTIEGALGGITASIIAGFLIKYYLLHDMGWIRCLLISIIISMAGQIGDLFESELKRSSNIKDSGKLLPGHGGVLDRIDALLFAAPFAYLFKEII